MSEFKPTPSQDLAINTKGRAVLVSAAAGSGKTKVLTERLLSRITDDADIDSFLIITFTKAAAAELKGRIMDEISARLAEQPDNRRLRRQNALLQRAQIGTIDSFCANLLKEHCHAAGLSPEFKVIEEDRSAIIKARVLERLMERQYENMSEEFKQLADTVGAGRDDSRLAALVLNLHNKMQSHARPEKWAEKQAQLLAAGYDDAADSPWGAEVLSSLKQTADYWAAEMEELCAAAAQYGKIFAAYGESLDETAAQIRNFSRALDIGWDKAASALPIEYISFKPLKDSPDAELSEHIKNTRKACKKVTDSFMDVLSKSSADILSELSKSAPAMKELLRLTLDFDKAYAVEKKRRAEVDFPDLEHMAARLLTEEDGSPTALAKELSGRFTEIMVDEYQDVNRVQDTIFKAVSKNETNLFMVGDVKQSIYRFRLADPSIFTEKYLSYADVSKAKEGEPVRIMLQENFRSRAEVINAANHVFKTDMSAKLGDVDYDENASLKCGAVYPENVPVPELVLLDTLTEDEDSPDKNAMEAAMVARRIKGLVENKTPVFDKGQMRPMRFSDVAILMRSANAVGDVYRRELIKAGVPVMSGQGGSFFRSVEISFVQCLLATIDNPHQDVALIAVLRSPAFGFTPDELSMIRAEDKKADYYGALCLAAEKNEKCAEFLDKLKLFRTLAPDTDLAELLWRIYDELDLMAVCSAMTDGESRRDNLMLMLEYAKRFESSGYRGLHRFVQWFTKLAEKGEEPGRGVSGNAVQIMTVHKSKGLEFPVVFLCDTMRRFNKMELRETVLIHPELGLGPKVIDANRGIEYPSLALNAIKLRAERELLSEEMRLLYVALTRAKEYLFMTAAVKSPEDVLEKLRNSAKCPMPAEMLRSVQAPGYWLMYAALADREGKMRISIERYEAEEAEREACEAMQVPEADTEAVRELSRRLSFEYAHSAAETLPSKVTATELKGLAEPDEEAAPLVPKRYKPFRNPDFMKNDKPLSGTEKGTATHLLLQYIDYEKTSSTEEIGNELARLKERKFLNERQAQAVDTKSVYELFASPLGKRILNAKKINREFKFSILCPADKFFGGDCADSVLLQGVIDCFIEEPDGLVIIDYKTDNVKGEAAYERAEVYWPQLRAYAYAIEKITGKKVKECALYFLNAGKCVYMGEK